MRTVSGELRLNKKEREAVSVFLKHAKMDMAYSGNGTYCKPESLENELDVLEIKKGRLGLEVLEFMLEGLCPDWQ